MHSHVASNQGVHGDGKGKIVTNKKISRDTMGTQNQNIDLQMRLVRPATGIITCLLQNSEVIRFDHAVVLGSHASEVSVV
jgi:hypothetical protein